jgi:hypothetical protein
MDWLASLSRSAPAQPVVQEPEHPEGVDPLAVYLQQREHERQQQKVEAQREEDQRPFAARLAAARAELEADARRERLMTREDRAHRDELRAQLRYAGDLDMWQVEQQAAAEQAAIDAPAPAPRTAAEVLWPK